MFEMHYLHYQIKSDRMAGFFIKHIDRRYVKAS